MEINPQFWQALDTLLAHSPIVIDRPKGSALDYGYLEGTLSMDGEGVDLWVGSREPRVVDAVLCVVDMPKGETEIKLLCGCTEEEKQMAYQFQNRPPHLLALLVRREDPSRKG